MLRFEEFVFLQVVLYVTDKRSFLALKLVTAPINLEQILRKHVML